MSSPTPLPTPKPAIGKIIIHEFIAKDTSDEHNWYFVAVAPSRSEEFLAAIQQPGADIDLMQYGKVLALGKGNEIPEEVRKEIYTRYAVAS